MPSRDNVLARTRITEQHLFWGSLGLGASMVVALALIYESLLLLAFVPAAAAVLCLIVWPQAATLLTVFVLYTNAAVVAVKFHGVPYVVGAMAVLPLAIPLLYHIVLRREKIVVTKTLPLIVAFFTIQFAGALFSTQPTHALEELTTSLLEGLLLYLVIINVVRTEAILKQVVWVLIAAGVFMGSLSVYQQWTRTFQNNYWGFAQVQTGEGIRVQEDYGIVRQKRLAGPVGQQNRYAQIMLILVPLGLFRYWGEHSASRRIVALAATALIAVGWALAFSRGSALAFAFLIVLMCMLGYIKVRQFAAVALGAVLLLALLPQFWIRLATLPRALDVVLGEIDPAAPPDGAIRGRATEMMAAARVWADHPLLGVGPGVFELYSGEYGQLGGLRELEGTRKAHSLYLELAAEHGIIGLGCFLAIVWVTLRNLARVRRSLLPDRVDTACLATGFLLMLVAYLATGMFAHLSYVRYFWLMLALADAASLVCQPAQPPLPPLPEPVPVSES